MNQTYNNVAFLYNDVALCENKPYLKIFLTITHAIVIFSILVQRLTISVGVEKLGI